MYKNILRYSPEIDSLRTIAVFSVILFHFSPEILRGGFLGVDIFFVISGYLMVTIINNKIIDNNFSFSTFYLRRIKRLIPSLLTMTVFIIVLGFVFSPPNELVNIFEGALSSLLNFSNIYFYFESGYFDQAAQNNPFIHTWTLSLEEQFYIFLPIFLVIFRKYTFYALIVLFLISLYAGNFFSTINPNFSFYGLPTRLFEFIAGGLIPFIRPISYEYKKSKFIKLISVSSFLILIICLFIFDENTFHPSYITLIPIISTCLLIYLNFSGLSFLKYNLFSETGKMSYSLYLFHQPVIIFLLINGIHSIIISLIILVSISYLNYKYIELNFRYNYSNKALKVFLIIGYVLIIAISLVGFRNSGYPERFENLPTGYLKEFSEHNDFVTSKFDSLILSPLKIESKNKKVIVVGDSFAQDFTNVLFDLNANLDISTHYISGKCGNLFMNDYSLIQNNILSECDKPNNVLIPNGRYESEKLLINISLADYIFLASNFEKWQIPYLKETINNIKNINNQINVYVVSLKEFNYPSKYKILKATNEERSEMYSNYSPNYISIYNALKKQVNKENLFDLNDYISKLDNNSKLTTSLFDNNGEIISYDGKHLTDHGSKYFAEKIKEKNKFFLENNKNLK